MEEEMKKTLLTSLIKTVMVLLLIISVNTFASADSKKSRANRIVGLWNVQVTGLDCNTGDQLFTFPALHKYELGGTGQVVPATNPAGLSAHMMIWNHISKNDYEITVKMFAFDPSGNNIGYAVIRGNVAIDNSATQYSGSAQAEFFDLNGNSLGVSCPTFAGTRFQ
jgi:hypothetical protein